MNWPFEVAFWPGPWISHGGPCVYGGGKNPAKNEGNGGGWRKSEGEFGSSCQASLGFLLEWGGAGRSALFNCLEVRAAERGTRPSQWTTVHTSKIANLLLSRSSGAMIGNSDPSIMKTMFIGV